MKQARKKQQAKHRRREAGTRARKPPIERRTDVRPAGERTDVWFSWNEYQSIHQSRLKQWIITRDWGDGWKLFLSIFNLARGGVFFSFPPLSNSVVYKNWLTRRSKREEGDRVCIGTAYVPRYIHREARKKVQVQYKYSTRVLLPIAIDLHLKAPSKNRGTRNRTLYIILL